MPSRFDEDILKDIFRWQLQRRQALDAATAMPTTVVVVLIGGITYLAREWMKLDYGFGSKLVLVGIAAASVAVALAIISLFRTVWQYQTADLPPPNELAEYIRRLREFYVASGSADVEQATEKRFREKLTDDYRVAGEVNWATNERRASFLFWARRCIIVATVSLTVAATGLTFAPVKPVADDAPKKLNSEAKMAEEPTPAPAQTAPTPTQPAAAPPQEPEPPPLRICKASDDPPPRKTALSENQTEKPSK